MRASRLVVFGLVCAGVLPARPRDARADDDACVAASEEALALRKQEKLTAALRPLATCTDPTCPQEVRAVCMKRLEDVKAAIPTLVLTAKDGADNDLAEVRVTMDGALLTDRLDGRAFSVDPGEHTFVFEVQGQPPLEKKLVIGEGEKDRREAVVLGPAPAPAPAPLPTGSEAPHPDRAVEPAAGRSTWGTQRTFAAISAGFGVIGVGVGVGFGLAALSSSNDSKSACQSTTNCANRGGANSAHDTAVTDGLVSDIAFAAGGAVLAAAVVLWFTAPSPEGASRSSAHGVRLVPAFVGAAHGLGLAGTF